MKGSENRMLCFNASIYQEMYGAICGDAKGAHLCSCACYCSCHCRCGICKDDSYEDIMW